jgi:N-acyl homoserine lactone hydrolase
MKAPIANAVTLPLPGGAPGATVILHPLLSAELRSPPGWFHRSTGPLASLQALGVGISSDDQIRIPIVSFLLEHPSVGAVLIDTGFHSSVLKQPRQNLGVIGSLLARGMRMDPAMSTAAQCMARGIDAADIELIVMTHLHFDHASALCDFPNATVLVSNVEWKSALSRRAPFNGYVRAQLDPRLTYRTFDFQGPSTTPLGPFTATLDLFGDGSIVLLSTPGHSAGHTAVLLRLSDREALIAGDAIYTMDTLRTGRRPWRTEDSDAFERSVAEIEVFDRDHPDALIIPGHDMDHWERLSKRYS